VCEPTAPMPIDGITQFVSGGGGDELYPLRRDARLAFGGDRTYGALRLRLRPGAAAYALCAVNGCILDSGTVRCRTLALGLASPLRPVQVVVLGDFGHPSLASQTADSQRVATRTDLRGVGGRDRRVIGLDDLEGVLKDVGKKNAGTPTANMASATCAVRPTEVFVILHIPDEQALRRNQGVGGHDVGGFHRPSVFDTQRCTPARTGTYSGNGLSREKAVKELGGTGLVCQDRAARRAGGVHVLPTPCRSASSIFSSWGAGAPRGARGVTKMHTWPMCALLACVLVLVTTTTASAQTSAAGHLRVAIDTAVSSADFSATAARDDFVILQESEQARMRDLKAQNPNLKVLMYKNLSAMQSADSLGNASAGITTQEARSEWYLLDTSGQRFTFGGYPFLWAGDIGDPGYQQRWADDVLATLQAQGWDGVLMDDTNYSIKYHYDPSDVAKYPTNAQYGAAMRSMVANVGPQIQRAGKLAFANMQWAEFPTPTNDWLQFLDGGMDEVFTQSARSVGKSVADLGRWSTQLANVKEAEHQGKAMLAVTQSANGDQEAARRGWATALLGGQGHIYFALHGDYTNENWFEEYGYALGDPTAAESQDSTGIHRRLFSNGLVLVNPTGSSVSVDFGGSYSGSGLTDVSGTVMRPQTGLILTRNHVSSWGSMVAPLFGLSSGPTERG
jgi:hypothetical protein